MKMESALTSSNEEMKKRSFKIYYADGMGGLFEAISMPSVI